ncbi:hypothetical protein bb8_p27 [Bordetella phage vB_BbrP_BB8]|uniref:Uncharacterized protein n=1 Tax=Bordetella phage vB_BbrP_BB8 TaxID=2587820 RepID=A0A4Y5TNX6_9CAUD|nr:hypothetical protein bb8_p27 [Bordetella phage vB_BbrP_BB8]
MKLGRNLNFKTQVKTYTYAHINPDTGEVVYIGSGTGERAWTITSKRSEPHVKFLRNLERMGYTPADWVVVLTPGLTREQAFALESRLIHEVAPIFNRMGVSAANAGRGESNHNSVLTADLVRQIRQEFPSSGLSIRATARKYGVAYTTMRKVLAGQAWAHI